MDVLIILAGNVFCMVIGFISGSYWALTELRKEDVQKKDGKGKS